MLAISGVQLWRTLQIPHDGSARRPKTEAAQLRFSYSFDRPDKTYTLPDVLKEISGIAMKDDNTLYCVQDELGVIYTYDLVTGRIRDEMTFGEPGDYEDITIGEGYIYVLRSDGLVIKINERTSEIESHSEISVPCNNIEGLFLSETDKAVYLACKSAAPEIQLQARTVYRYVDSMKSDPVPVLTITQQDVRSRISVEASAGKKEKMIFNPSAAHR
jgi:hypothetical protein